jgi:hypothetical protein
MAETKKPAAPSWFSEERIHEVLPSGQIVVHVEKVFEDEGARNRVFRILDALRRRFPDVDPR